jgi:predicted DNA-binding protein with PD1-like motif
MVHDVLSGKIERIVALTISSGGDLRSAVENAVKKEGIRCGVIISGIGTLEKMVFTNMKSGAVPPEVTLVNMEGPMELLSLGGNISLELKEESGKAKESISVHMHAWCSDKEGRVFGGSIGAGNIVWLQVDVVIAEIGGLAFRREVNERKLMRIVLEKR